MILTSKLTFRPLENEDHSDFSISISESASNFWFQDDCTISTQLNSLKGNNFSGGTFQNLGLKR